jgi:hypothetical protein
LAKNPRTPFHYHFYGRSFSSSVPLPGAKPLQKPATQRGIVLHIGIPPSLNSSPLTETEIYRSVEIDSSGEPLLRISDIVQDASVKMVYSDGTEFWIDGKREHVWAIWSSTSCLENTVSYLLGPVLGLLLRLKGVTCLHASAVAFGDCSVAFLGATGMGKSTTAAAFARLGFAILSDDIVALSESHGDFLVRPGYPRVCLWPESVEMLYGSADALPKILPEDEKRLLALGDGSARYETRALRLAAIYVLADRRSDPAPIVEPLGARPALLSLVTDSFANRVLDREMRAQEFDVLSRLATQVPVRRVFPHRDPGKVHHLCEAIWKDFAAL